MTVNDMIKLLNSLNESAKEKPIVFCHNPSNDICDDYIPEFDTSNSDYSSDKGAALILNQQFSQPQNAGKYLFTKDDISRIEYKKIYKDKYMGQGFFVYEICFNDPRTFTYKPVFTRCILQKNGMFGLDAKADKSMEDILNAFQGVIGSNLQVVKVSKYS